MNSVCGICFEKSEELFQLNNSFIKGCAKCLKRMNANKQQNQFAKISDISDISEQECPICGKYFARRYSFMNHVRNHSAERKHICRYCQKAFTQAANLRNHERIHTNERPYSCTVCQKSFTQITNLNNHLRLHTGERPFQCPVKGCEKAFAQVTNLNNHSKTHQRDKWVKCSICHKSFAQYSELSDHHRMHRLSNRSVYKESKNKSSQNIYLNKLCEQGSISNIKLEPEILSGQNLIRNIYNDSDIKIEQCNEYGFSERNRVSSLHKEKIGECILPDINMDFQDIYRSDQNQIINNKCLSHETYRRKTKIEEVLNQDESNFHISCYFENCKKKFEKNDDLNVHLNDIHGLSIFNRFDEKGMVKQYL